MPIATTTALTIAAVAGTTLTAYGQYKQGKAAKRASRAQAEIYTAQAKRELEIGKLNASRTREEAARLAGTQIALLAAQGRDISSGSALLVQEDLAEEGEFNAELAENNAAAQVSSLQTQRVLALAEGDSAMTAGYLRAGSTLLKGGVQAFG